MASKLKGAQFLEPNNILESDGLRKNRARTQIIWFNRPVQASVDLATKSYDYIRPHQN
jgi:hypothetical protein